MVSIESLTGVAVHHAISAMVSRWAEGKPTRATDVRARGKEFVETTWKERRNSLLEVRNGLEVTGADVEHITHAVDARIDRFLRHVWPRFSHLKHETHERLLRFAVGGRFIAVQMDLAGWNADGKLWIVDWKTGHWQGTDEDRTQLVAYALWANAALDAKPTDIAAFVAILDSGLVVPFQVFESDLDWGRERIEEDFATVDRFRRQGNFPTSAAPALCRSCRYLKTCDDGRDVMGL